MFTWINGILTFLFITLIWMFTKIKQIYTQLNRRNSKVPDVDILKKIVPPTSAMGWRIVTVCNGVPLWLYKGSFTFAPNNIIAGRALLNHKSDKVLQELVKIKTFSELFPESPALKVETNNTILNQDVVSLSNINTSLSLTSIVTCHLSHVNFTLERYWFSTTSKSWIYMCPTSMLLAHQYGYWLSFMMQDLENGKGCSMYVLASFPSSVSSKLVYHMISSCLVLAQEHIDSNYIYEQKNINEEVSVLRDVSPKPQNIFDDKKKISTDRGSPLLIVKPTPKKMSILRNEAVGYEEKPAEIQRIPTPDKSYAENGEKVDKMELIYNHKEENPKRIIDQLLIIDDDIKKSQHNKELNKQNKKYSSEVLEKLSLYEKDLDVGFKRLISAYEANGTTPGWSDMGTRNGVKIFTQHGDSLSPATCNKGTSEVHVPLNYLLEYLLNIEYKKDYDSLFEQGVDIELLGDGLTKIINLQYQNIWPTTGRDFCSISAVRHLKENLYGVMLKAVTHPDCPERKNKVRGEVIIAGYVLDEKSKHPPVISLTYLTRGELKGSVPQRIVNRVTSEQPMFAASIREHCERRYQIDDPPKSSCKDWLSIISAAPSIFEEQKPEVDQNSQQPEPIRKAEDELSNANDLDAPISTTRTTANSNNLGTSGTAPDNVGELEIQTDNAVIGTSTSEVKSETPHEISVPAESGTVLPSGFDLQENYYAPVKGEVHLPQRISDEDSLMNDSESVGDISQFTEDLQTTLSISDQLLELPRDANGNIDFITLGNQTAAALEQEFFLTQDLLKTPTATALNEAATVTDSWVSLGTTKHVQIMRKVHSNQKYHSFLGSGVINVLPVTVWEAIRNPTTRFVYDNMLKRSTVVKEISERHKIVHMRHETQACFVKQARDFCVLTVERVGQQRYVLAAVSVDIPECPPVRDCVRGVILSSGWIVEPILRNGRSCSNVTYISQVNFGGRLPSRVINFISKRQPLALAYLRDYLESAEI